MQASPPETIEKRAPAREATEPASMSPSRGPLVTTSENTEDMRPRMASGVTVRLITERQTGVAAATPVGLITARRPALPLPPARAIPSGAPAGHRLGIRPASATAAPQTT